MRKHFKKLISLMIFLFSISYIYGEGLEVDYNKGFVISSKDYIESIDSQLITYKHKKTGAKLIYIKNSDPNKVFAIGFKTPVHDNTGVNHIIEHAVFTGSNKYNINDVFFEMKKKSPNIFMNASTAVDMTIYPFSTRNKKDYYNLLDVYLDAVFFPNLQNHRHGFDQEGWHYSIDKDNRYQINGVVYNEMKGASVDPRRILAMANRKAMFPDTMYIYNAGGNPEEIPKLTYNNFKKTHKKYYTPSNSCAFVYGEVDIHQLLSKIDSYYSKFTREKDQNICDYQKGFNHKKYYSEYYPAINNLENYYLSNNYVVGLADDYKLQLSMNILMDILTGYEGSPLREALQRENLARTIAYDIDSGLPQPMYSIVTTDVKKDHIKKLDNLIDRTLEEIAANGIESDIITMAINQYEIKSRENASEISKGINMAYKLLYGWGHGLSPTKTLKSQDYINEIKREGSSKYFQELIKSYMIDNKHKSLVTLIPDEDYISRLQKREELIKDRQSRGSNFLKKGKTIKNKENLEKWQRQTRKQEELPDLKIEELSSFAELPKLDIRPSNKLYYIADTRGLIYIDLYFDTSYIPQESLNELFLFSYLLREKEKTSQSLYTGGLTTSIVAIPVFESHEEYMPKLRLSMVLEEENIDKGFEIIEGISRCNKWNEDWLFSQIQKISSHYCKYLKSNPQELVGLSLENSKQGAGRYEYEQVISFYQYICHIEENYPKYKDKIISKLQIINDSVFNKNNIILGACLEDKNIKTLESNYKLYLDSLDKEDYSKEKYKFKKGEKRQGFEIASDVQYISWGGNYKEKGGSYNGALYVIANIINSEYMLNNIRVKNGAYGAGFSFNPFGDMSAYTYQDPKLYESLEIIENIPDYLDKLDLDNDSLDAYKIGALSRFEGELGLNESPYTIARTLQMYHIGGLTLDDLLQIRQEILNTSLEDIKTEVATIDSIIRDKRYSVAGSRSKLKKYRNSFDIIR